MAKRPKGRPVPTDKLEEGAAHAEVSGSSLEMVIGEEVGRTINGRFEITNVIGEGGMGVVYEAYDNQVDRNVAIKLVRSECLADRKFLSRFRRELEVTTQLRHPSTIRVFEHGEAEDGRPYMVMELLTGTSLAERLERGRIQEIEALQHARQIAESLSEAHEAGIFHRDLKPDNIFIETVGVSTVVKVLDFGIAGGLDATRLTQAGEVFGTPQYMSPEQCNGLPLDHRTDIYSLGCILYEMIEGTPPFAAESPMATMLKHVRAKVPPPKHCCRETAKVLMMALRKDRNKRIQDCGRFAALIGECIGAARSHKEGKSPVSGQVSRLPSTGPIPALAPNTPTTGPVTASRLPGSAMWVIGGLGVAFIGIVGYMMFAEPSEAKSDGTTDDEKAAATGEAGEEDDRADKKFPNNRAYISSNVEGATVYLDGEEKCLTPCEILVPVGDGTEHDIVLKKTGFIDVERRWQPRTVVEDPPQLPPMAETKSTITVKGED
jgi:serine/threonine-protein kinase